MDWLRIIRRKRWRGLWKFKKSLIALMTGIVLVVPFLSSSNACSFPAIYNFGDSNSDTGAVSAAFGRVPFPNGKTFFGKPSGRFCDGRLIIDFLGNLHFFASCIFILSILQGDFFI